MHPMNTDWCFVIQNHVKEGKKSIYKHIHPYTHTREREIEIEMGRRGQESRKGIKGDEEL